MKKVVLCVIGMFMTAIAVASAVETFLWMREVARWTDLEAKPYEE